MWCRAVCFECAPLQASCFYEDRTDCLCWRLREARPDHRGVLKLSVLPGWALARRLLRSAASQHLVPGQRFSSAVRNTQPPQVFWHALLYYFVLLQMTFGVSSSVTLLFDFWDVHGPAGEPRIIRFISVTTSKLLRVGVAAALIITSSSGRDIP